MADKQERGQHMKIYLRENNPQHMYLRKKCDSRDRKKYKTAADFLAEAVARMEANDTMTLVIDTHDFPDHVMAAVDVIRKHCQKNKKRG